MKKFVYILIATIFILILSSCKVVEETEKPLEKEELNEPVDNTTFDEYLNKNINTINLEKFNEIFSINIDCDFISNISFPKGNIIFEVDGFEKLEKYNENDVILWQEDNVIYTYSNIDEKEELIKFDLAEIEDYLTADFVEIDGIYLSDILDALLKEINGTDDISFGLLLEKLNLTSNDFIKKENDIYELKRETITRFIVAASNNSISLDKASQILENYFEKLMINVKFENGKIRDIGMILEVNFQNSFELKTSLSIKFQYDDSKLFKVDFGINLSINYLSGDKNDLIVAMYGFILENETNLHIKLIKDEITEISFVLSENIYQLEFFEIDKEDNLNKEFKINFSMEEDAVSGLDVSYRIDQGRNEKNIQIHFSKELEIDIPKIQVEDAVSIFDYLTDDELKDN
jgi:hypothetical protein